MFFEEDALFLVVVVVVLVERLLLLPLLLLEEEEEEDGVCTITFLIVARHTGQAFLRFRKIFVQSEHVYMCPHGTNKALRSFSIHTIHFVGSSVVMVLSLIHI